MVVPRSERPYMPDYGVDTAPWTPLPWSWAVQRLVANRTFWVVTVSADGRPHATPIWGVWDPDRGRFAFSCGPRSRKARDLAVNRRTAVMIEATVECLSLEGLAAAVDDEESQARWTERYLAKYQPHAPSLDAGFVRQNLLVEFTPERAYGVIEREDEFATRATRWVFDGTP